MYLVIGKVLFCIQLALDAKFVLRSEFSFARYNGTILHAAICLSSIWATSNQSFKITSLVYKDAERKDVKKQLISCSSKEITLGIIPVHIQTGQQSYGRIQ